MLRFLLRRLATTTLTLAVIVTLSFFLMRLAPGGPFDGERRLPPEVEANLLAKYQLDQPVYLQFFSYVSQLAQGDLGPSFRQKDFTVNELIAAGAPVSLTLGAIALLLALLFGIGIGVAAALNFDRPLDHGLMSFAMLGIALPPFVTAPLLVLLFGIVLQWLPVAGWEGLSAPHLLLPCVALAAPYAAAIARLTRGSVLECLSASFVRAARAKGIGASMVLVRHVLPAALIPVVSFLGPASAALLTGSVVIEQVFDLPGIGRYFVQGALARDYSLVMGVVILYAITLMLMNLLADLLHAKLDPRMKHP